MLVHVCVSFLVSSFELSKNDLNDAAPRAAGSDSGPVGIPVTSFKVRITGWPAVRFGTSRLRTPHTSRPGHRKPDAKRGWKIPSWDGLRCSFWRAVHLDTGR